MQVSVIIPVYNGQDYLHRSLDSLLGQTYQNWQGIIVDDGSTDGSGSIADAYSQKDARFSVIHKANEGQSMARIEGALASKGELIMFLDSDDAWESHCLESVTNTFRAFDADVVMFPAKVVREDGSIKHVVGDGLGEGGYIDKNLVYEKLLSSHDLNSLWLKAFKRDVVDPEELKEVADRNVRIGEDKMMLLPLITKANKLYYLNDPLYLYTHHDSSISHQCKASKISAMIAKTAFEETGRYMSVWNMDDEEHRRKLEIYYLKHLMNCFYKMRKHCKEKEERKQFKKYPWRDEMRLKVGTYLRGSDLSFKEKIKLIFMRISV